ILKHHLRKLMQASAPSKELVGCFRRHIRNVLDAGLLEGFVVGVDVARILTAAAATEHHFDLLLETRRILDIGGGDDAAAEEADLGKLVEILQGDDLGFHPAHGKPSHATMSLIAQSTEVGVDIRNEFVYENHLKCSGGPAKGVHTAATTSGAASRGRCIGSSRGGIRRSSGCRCS